MLQTTRISLLLAISLTCAAATTQNAPVRGPILGYVLDRSGQALRTVQGTPGAALMGNPLPAPFAIDETKVSGSADYAFIRETGSGQLSIVRWEESGSSTRRMEWAYPDRITLSPSGKVAVFYYAERNAVSLIGGLPEDPVVLREHAFDSVSGKTEGFAVSDFGDLLVSVSSDDQHRLLLYTGGGEGELIAVGNARVAAAFLSKSRDAVAAENGEIVRYRKAGATLERSVLAAEWAGLDEITHIEVDRENQWVAAIQAGNPAILLVSLTGPSVSSVLCPCVPTRLERMNGPGVFGLNETAPLWLLDTSTVPARTVFVPAPLQATPAEPIGDGIAAAFQLSPLRFEPNQGQMDEQVRFAARGTGYHLQLEQTGAKLTLQHRDQPPDVIGMSFDGANAASAIAGGGRLPGRVNYFLGSEPERWRTGIPTFERVEYQHVYPGVDLVFYGKQGELEYDFLVEPGADPKSIGLNFSGTRSVKVDPAGDLVLTVSGGEFRMRKPYAYQNIGDERREVPAKFVADGPRVSFEVGAYDTAESLVIDPVLVYSTYLGGTNADVSNAIVIDSSRNAYVAGRTTSTNFPAVATVNRTLQGQGDIFVTKLGPTGTVLYSTYIGGIGDETVNDLAVDAQGNVYAAASSDSPNFAGPTSANNGGTDAVVFGLSPTGVLIMSRFVGGALEDTANGIALDAAGGIYITGTTRSLNFPVDRTLTDAEAFAMKLTTNATTVYITLLRGSQDDFGRDLVVDSAGQATIVGNTFSRDFAVTSPIQAALAAGSDAFIARLNPVGAITFASFLGGFGNDIANSIAADSTGIYVGGTTDSGNFPALRAIQGLGGGTDAFVTRINSSLTGYVYSTYLGGNGDDQLLDMVADGLGSLFLIGSTTSQDFPLLNAAQVPFLGGREIFITQLNSTPGIAFSTFFGGNRDDIGTSIAVDSVVGDLFITGYTSSTDFSIANAFQGSRSGDFDAFVSRISESARRPPNDDFENALSITGAAGSTTGQNNGATFESKEPTGRGGRNTVWWQWNVPFSGTASVDTIGSNFDTSLSIYRGPLDLSSLTLVTSDDDSGGGGTSRASFQATQGTTYYIQVSGFNNASGNIVLNWGVGAQPITGTVDIRITPGSVTPAQQQAASVSLSQGYPLPITGQLIVSFTADALVPGDDPSIQFATGGRVVNFTIPANTSQAIFSDGSTAIPFQTGTVAGTIAFRVRLSATIPGAGTQDVTPVPEPRSTVSVGRQVPTITSVVIGNLTESGFDMVITGYSTFRQVNQVLFTFTPASGTTLQNATVSIDVSSIFSTWYQDANSSQFGSQFRLRIPFTLDGGRSSGLSAVSVILSNSLGNSAVINRGF